MGGGAYEKWSGLSSPGDNTVRGRFAFNSASLSGLFAAKVENRAFLRGFFSPVFSLRFLLFNVFLVVAPPLCFLVVLLQAAPAAAAVAPVDLESRVRVAPAPAWVSPLPLPGRHSGANQIEPGQQQRVLLEDRQINAETNEDFLHETRELSMLGAPQTRSVISVNFDPACQYLTFHWVRVWRGSNSFNYLDRNKIKIVEPERGSGGSLFASVESAVLSLDDVRTGDIIDYAYTLRDENLKAKGGRFSGQVILQSYQPIQQLRTRLIWPAQRLLYIQNHQTQARPSKVQKNDVIEFTWNLTNLPAIAWEPPLPAWFDPQPSVQLSGFQNWGEVNRWLLALFNIDSPLSPELTQQINFWRRIVAPEDRVLTILRFVQNEVLNQPAQPGSNSYAPSAPSLVFSRRSGDCQDKVLFYVASLRALGIEAYPALVNTRRRQAIENWHPAADLFDHAIVQVVLPGQGTFWLDPSSVHENGPLALRSHADYGFGLIVRPGTTALAAIPPPDILPKTMLTEFWRIRGVGHPSELRAVTVAEGPDAVRLRARFANAKREDIEREDLDRYASFYPRIMRMRPLTFADDEQENQVTVTEFYRVERMWSRAADEFAYHLRIYSHNIGAAIQMPAALQRTMPLGLDYPQHEVYRAEIEGSAQTFAAAPENRTIQNPAFYFHRAVSKVPNGIAFECEFATLADSVPPEMMLTYARQLSQVADAQDYILYSP